MTKHILMRAAAAAPSRVYSVHGSFCRAKIAVKGVAAIGVILAAPVFAAAQTAGQSSDAAAPRAEAPATPRQITPEAAAPKTTAPTDELPADELPTAAPFSQAEPGVDLDDFFKKAEEQTRKAQESSGPNCVPKPEADTSKPIS